MNGVSVIVLTWNGEELVRECFPRIYESVQSWTVPREILLVDNGSEDNTLEYIRETFPDVRIIAFERNLGFAAANNKAVKDAKFDKLLFLNNDLVLEDGFLDPMLKRLEDKDVFAVAPKILRWDKETIDDGLRYAKFYSGLFDVSLDTERDKVDLPHYVTFFCGACFVCCRDDFLSFGGFDELYTPYAWEDLDLGYRAWKRGMKVIYEPASIAYHKREATTRGAFSHFFFITLMWRNKFIFMWKNLTDADLISEHLALLPWKLLKFLFNGRWLYTIGFLRALKSLPLVLMKRSNEKEMIKLKDRDVLDNSYRVIS